MACANVKDISKMTSTSEVKLNFLVHKNNRLLLENIVSYCTSKYRLKFIDNLMPYICSWQTIDLQSIHPHPHPSTSIENNFYSVSFNWNIMSDVMKHFRWKREYMTNIDLWSLTQIEGRGKKSTHWFIIMIDSVNIQTGNMKRKLRWRKYILMKKKKSKKTCFWITTSCESVKSILKVFK